MSRTEEIINALPIGADNAVSMASLAAALGINERTLRENVRSARFEGAEIVGDKRGYYRPATPEERNRFYEMFRKRALCSLASVSTIHARIKEEQPEQIPGQMSIFDYIGKEPDKNQEAE